MRFVIVTGDRHYNKRDVIKGALDVYRAKHTSICVVHGSADGADSIAELWCKRTKNPYHGYPAQWHRYENGAGPVRNKLMLDLYPDAEVLAFHDNLEESKGTKDMIEQAQERGRKVTLYTKGQILEQLELID